MNDNEIFIAALRLEQAAERTAYLAQVCANKPEQRDRIERLLAAHAAAGTPPYAPVGNPGSTRRFDLSQGAEPSDLPPRPEGPGSRIGPYKLLQKLGEGGMGAIYMAEQQEPVRRNVALKIIKAGMDSARVIARFEQERQALAMMDHPNIAKVLDAGATDSGRPYFVMELVKGIPFTKYCDHEHLTPRERLELFVPVCQAVQHAHQKGIIHRDLKPSNILIALYDGKPVPKVIDFGVAKATSQKLTERTMFTEVGQIIGTLEYMAPEQAELNNLDIDTRADIYSLGVLLYELLTGSTPFPSTTLRAAGFTEMVRLIRDVEPPRPSTKLSSSAELPAIAAKRKLEPKKLTRLVHGDLDWIVMKALEKDRSRRYETANGLAMDVQRYLNDEPVSAGPPSPAYRLRKLVRRHKGAVGTAVIVLLALVAGMVISTGQAVRATLAEARASQERDAANKAAAQAAAISKFLTEDLLGEAAPDQNSRDRGVTVEQLLDKAALNIPSNKRFVGQPEIEASIRQVIGNTYFKLGALKQAEPHLRRALELRRSAFGPDHPDTLSAQEDLAWFLAGGLRKLDEAGELSRQTWEARRRVLGAEHSDALNSMDTYCTALFVQSRYAECEPVMRECWETRERVLGREHTDTLTSLNNYGSLLRELGRWAESEALLRKALEVRRRVTGMDKEPTIGSLNNLCVALVLNNKLAEAEILLREGIEAMARSHGPEHHLTVHLRYMLARALLEQGRRDEAETLARETLAARRKLLPAGHENIGRSLLLLGRIYLEKDRPTDAEPVLHEALGLFRERYSMKYELLADAAEWLGACLLASDRFTEAEPLLRECVTLRVRHFPDMWTTYSAKALLGASLLGQKKYADAEPLLLGGYEGLRTRTKRISLQGRARLVASAEQLTQLYVATGNNHKAEEWRATVTELRAAGQSP